MAQIKVVVCIGTTCYVMGAGHLLAIKDYIDDDMAEKVAIEGSVCLGLCKNDQYCGAPYAKVDDTVISEATMVKIVDEIRRKLT